MLLSPDMLLRCDQASGPNHLARRVSDKASISTPGGGEEVRSPQDSLRERLARDIQSVDQRAARGTCCATLHIAVPGDVLYPIRPALMSRAWCRTLCLGQRTEALCGTPFLSSCAPACSFDRQPGMRTKESLHVRFQRYCQWQVYHHCVHTRRYFPRLACTWVIRINFRRRGISKPGLTPNVETLIAPLIWSALCVHLASVTYLLFLWPPLAVCCSDSNHSATTVRVWLPIRFHRFVSAVTCSPPPCRCRLMLYVQEFTYNHHAVFPCERIGDARNPGPSGACPEAEMALPLQQRGSPRPPATASVWTGRARTPALLTSPAPFQGVEHASTFKQRRADTATVTGLASNVQPAKLLSWHHHCL